MAEYAIPAQTESLAVIDNDGRVWTRAEYSEWWHSKFNGSSYEAPWADLLQLHGPVRDVPPKPDFDTIRDLIFNETSRQNRPDILAKKIMDLYDDWSKHAL